MVTKIANVFVCALILMIGIWGGLNLGMGKNASVLSATTDTSASVESRLSALEKRVAVLESKTGIVKVKTGVTQEYYMALMEGTAYGTDWTRIPSSDFQLDTSLYGSNVEVSWQGWMDEGIGSVRIYDETNYRAVDNSEVTIVSGVKSSFYSKTLSIWRGANRYSLQIRSIAGPVTISSPRLKIVVYK